MPFVLYGFVYFELVTQNNKVGQRSKDIAIYFHEDGDGVTERELKSRVNKRRETNVWQRMTVSKTSQITRSRQLFTTRRLSIVNH